jgi:hypothetical protein
MPPILNGFSLTNVYYRGYAVRILVEASKIQGDAHDKARDYRLEVGMGAGNDSSSCRLTYQAATGKLTTIRPVLSVGQLDTTESISSVQSANLNLSGASEVAALLRDRILPMDRVRIEITNGTEWRLAFDGFVSSESYRASSTPDSVSASFSISCSGLWKLLQQSWFNWHGVIEPGYDMKVGSEGQKLFVKFGKEPVMPPQEVIRYFIEAALALVKLETSDGRIGANGFFSLGSGKLWQSAFDIAYPLPVATLPSWKGPLSGLIQELAQPDIHECFVSYRKIGEREKPVLVFRPRPYPGAGPKKKDDPDVVSAPTEQDSQEMMAGDDANWKALPLHRIKDEPLAKSVMHQRSDHTHPNAFHWSNSSSDTAIKEYEQKLRYGYRIDTKSLDRFGYSARPVASTLPSISFVPEGSRKPFVDKMARLVERIAYQEACIPYLWSRTVQLPLRPGIHPGEVVEDWSLGVPWTGYVSTVEHRIAANPWTGQTTLTMVRCIQCKAEDYPSKMRSHVAIEHRSYVATNFAGAASDEETRASQRNPSLVAESYAGVPYGRAILFSAAAYGIPPWVLAHVASAESGFGSHPQTAERGGIMQFTTQTANGLNQAGYPKPFNRSKAVADPELSIDAAAWYLSTLNKRITSAMPIMMTDTQKWAWTIYGYNRGGSAAVSHGKDTNWTFTAEDKATPQYKNEWGPEAVDKGKATYGRLQ